MAAGVEGYVLEILTQMPIVLKYSYNIQKKT
jgi:hypothetical protein